MGASYPYPNRRNPRGQRLCAAATADGRPCDQPIARPGQQVCHFHVRWTPLPANAIGAASSDWAPDDHAAAALAQQAWFSEAHPETACASAAVAAGANVALVADGEDVKRLAIDSVRAGDARRVVCTVSTPHLGALVGHLLAPIDRMPKGLGGLVRRGGTLVLADVEAVPHYTLAALVSSLGLGVQRDLGTDINVVVACRDADAARRLPVMALAPRQHDALPVAPALDTTSPAFKQAVQYHAATLMAFVATENMHGPALGSAFPLWGSNYSVLHRLEAWGRIAAYLDEMAPLTTSQRDQLAAPALSQALQSPALERKYAGWKRREDLPAYEALGQLSPPQLVSVIDHAVDMGRPGRVLWSLLAARVVAQNYSDAQRAQMDAWVDDLWHHAANRHTLGNSRALADAIGRSFGARQLQLSPHTPLVTASS